MTIPVRLAASAALALPAMLVAQDAADDIASKVINQPSPQDFAVYGLAQSPKVRSDSKVQGGKALRVVIPGADRDAWKIALSDQIVKPIKAGDRLVLAFYARVEKGPNGGSSATLPSNSVQLAKEPYTGIFGGPVTLGPEWKMYNVAGKADRDYPAGALAVQLQLASGAQTLDFGPMFVLDLGQ